MSLLIARLGTVKRDGNRHGLLPAQRLGRLQSISSRASSSQ